MGTGFFTSRKGPLVVLFVAALAAGGACKKTGSTGGGSPTYVAPASIDNTGQTDVTDQLNDWIVNGTADGTAGDPAVIQLNGTYRVEYGLAIGSGGASTRFPDLPAYTRNHVILDLTNARLIQTDSTPYSVNGVVVEPRKRWGVPVLTIVNDTDVTVEGGTLDSSNTSGVYSSIRAAWHGVLIARGTSNIQLAGMHIEEVWGDFVYISGKVWPQSVLIDGGLFERNGRQGVTFNNVNDLEIRNVQFANVQRELFDHEPVAGGGATNVSIHNNSGGTGGLGYVNLRDAGTPMQNVSIANNHLSSGHFRVLASSGPNTTPRVGFSFTGNTTDETNPYSSSTPLIDVTGLWDTVTVTGNHDVGSANATAVAVSSQSTNVTTSPNDFVGFQ